MKKEMTLELNNDIDDIIKFQKLVVKQMKKMNHQSMIAFQEDVLKCLEALRSLGVSESQLN